jgi:beta-glucosidase
MALDVDRLVEQLTLDEKALLVSGSDFWHTTPIERLGIPAIMCADGPHGLRAQVDEHDHAGSLGSVPATCFPTASAIASTWDPDLVREIGSAIALEARRWNVSVVLGPGVNIKRSPLCGRNFEYLSEDPFLAGELGVAMVEGLQSRGVGASVKHYAANNQETDRLRVSAEVDERTLREIYLPAFERVVTGAEPWTVMCAYNRVNGTHASEHHWLLTGILRDEWGFDGVVVSDWGAVHDRVAALGAGLDWEMPPDLERSPAAVAEAVATGALDAEILDRSVRRMLALVDRGRDALAADEVVDVDAHHELARRAAAESVVLLKNDRDLLPLPADGTIAVIGELARRPRFQGAGSSQVNATRVDHLLDELAAVVGRDRIAFAEGYATGGDADPSASDRRRAEAVDAAASGDLALCVLGLPGAWESEGFDRTHIELPPDQVELLDAVLAVQQQVVVVLVNGGTVAVSGWADRVPAVVEAWLGGQAAAGGLADVLAGVVNPGGRLAETIPVRLADVPSTLNFPGDGGIVRYGEGVFVGYRAHDHLDQPVSFPFGHGLSYTTFELSDLAVSTAGAVDGGTPLSATVSVTVTNTGHRAGTHVVQVYVGDDAASVARPPRELRGFRKVRLDAGAEVRLTIDLDQRAFSFWSPTHHRWVVEAGDFTIAVGSSSRDLPLATRVSVEAPSLRAPLGHDSTLQEWLDDPGGWALLDDLLPSEHPLRNDGFVSVIGSFPMETLAAFGQLGVTHADLDRLVARLDARSDD